MVNSPVIILANPQLAENVGMVARAMLNFGFTNLRLVHPRDNNVINNASAASAGADTVLQQAQIFNDLLEATGDLNLVYATTARKRYINKPVINLLTLGEYHLSKQLEHSKVGFLFGAEKSGLSNNDLNCANIIVNIPSNPQFASLNLAQAVMLVCYEWSKKGSLTKSEKPLLLNQEVVSLEELAYFFQFLENSLDKRGFFAAETLHKERMIRNLRNIFLRNNLTKSELQTLYGVVKFLIKPEKN